MQQLEHEGDFTAEGIEAVRGRWITVLRCGSGCQQILGSLYQVRRCSLQE